MADRFFGSREVPGGTPESPPVRAQERFVEGRPPEERPTRSARVALLVGNAAYAGAQLRNPVNDVELLAEALRKLDFDVETLTDCGKTALEHAIVSFGLRVAETHGQAISVFYFSGHGIQHQGQNYLIPIDAHIPEARFLRSGAIRVDFLLEELARVPARANVIVLDACRNNPIPVVHQGPEVLRGLAAIESVPNATAIVFSTAAGSVASDGDGDHSPYALALSRALAHPGIKLRDVLFGAAAGASEATSGAQRPALFVQGMIPDVEVASPPANRGTPTKGPWGRAQNLDEFAERTAVDAGKVAPEVPDPLLTIERPLALGELRYGLSQQDWDQGMPGNLVNEVIDTGRWPQVEAGFQRSDPYAATLIAIRNMATLRPDWGAADTALAGRAALLGAKAGIRQAFMVLSYFYSTGGGGFPRDPKIHRAIVEGLAERGYGLAQLQLGIDLALGFSGVPAPGDAIGWFERAAESGATNALFEIGRLYTDAAKHPYQLNFEKARHYLERGVQANDARAATLLAELYLDGKLAARDPQEVNALLDMSITSGNATALFRRAMRLEHGDGVAPDLSRAMADYAAAAQAGSADAMLALSHHYTHGSGCTTIEPHKAVAYTEAALSRGGKAAHALLGRFYEHGFGVHANATRAEEYYQAAAIANDEMGHVGLARLGMRQAGSQRDAADIRRHVAAACASSNYAAKAAAEVILRQLQTFEKLATVPGTVTLEDITSGSADAPVSVVLCISMADAACALFERTVMPSLKSRFIEPGHVRLIVREGNAEEAGAWAVVRTAESTTRLSVLSRLLAAQAQWKGERDQVAAVATALADLDFDAQRVSRALASFDLISRIQYMGGPIAGSFGVAEVPTVFVNGLKLVRPDLARLEAAILLALPPEVAVGLNGASTLHLPGS